MVKLIFPIIIFISLGVIVYIIGKHLPDIRMRLMEKKKTVRSSGFLKKFFQSILSAVKRFFIFLAEIVVKKSKNLLHLVHFWLIKLKKRKSELKSESEIDFEVKEELIKEEQKTLDTVVNDNLAQSNQKRVQMDNIERHFQPINDEFISKEVIVEEKNESLEADYFEDNYVSKESIQKQQYETDQVTEFIEDKETDDELDQTMKPETDHQLKEKRIWTNKILGFFGKKETKDNNLAKDNEKENVFEEKVTVVEEKFSDGIGQVIEFESPEMKDNKLIREVVRIKKNNIIGQDLDEDLGIDRKILEKKILQKVAMNPKDPENYRQLGELYIKMENYQDAGECFNQVLRMKLRDADASRKLEKIKLLRRIKRK